MPIDLPRRNDETGELEPGIAYLPREVAEMFHISLSYVHARCREGDRNPWPHMRFGRRIYFLPEHIDGIYALAEHPRVPNGTSRLGRVIHDHEIEPVQ